MTWDLKLEDFSIVSMVTLLSVWQMATFAKKVGLCRMKFKIDPPITIDAKEPIFVRTFRAQQNCLEFYPLFLIAMWMTASFVHQVPASVLGVLYMYGRAKYFSGYSEKASGRMTGFKTAVLALRVLLYLSFGGVLHFLIRQYTGFHLAKRGRALFEDFIDL